MTAPSIHLAIMIGPETPVPACEISGDIPMIRFANTTAIQLDPHMDSARYLRQTAAALLHLAGQVERQRMGGAA